MNTGYNLQIIINLYSLRKYQVASFVGKENYLGRFWHEEDASAKLFATHIFIIYEIFMNQVRKKMIQDKKEN